MSLGGIKKETGRSTFDEIMRLRQRLDYIEGFRQSITQALVSTGSKTGPVGTPIPGITTASADGRYLKLLADNDPLLGSLEALDINVTGLVSITNSDTGLYVGVTSTESAVCFEQHGGLPDTLSPGSIDNVANNLLMWFESDTLGLSDGADVQTWTQSGAGLSTDLLLQGTASAAPHYRTGETPLGKPGVISEVTGQRMSKSEVDGIDWKYGSDQGGGTDKNAAFVCVYRTDDSASSNNILVMGNEDSAGLKHSFRPVGNADLGNSYVYNTNVLEVVGSGHAGHSGGTWHIAMFWYDASDDSNKLYIDGTNYDAGLTSDMEIDVDALFRDVGSGTENVAVGTGVAAMVMVCNNNTGAQTSLAEMIKVHDFLALEYMGEAYTIGSGSAAGDILQLKNDGTVKSVFDSAGQLHIGGSDPQVALDVEGDANISGLVTIGTTAAITGQLTAGSLEVTALTTLSGVDAGAVTADSLTVNGLLAVNNSTVTIVGTNGPSFHMTGPGPNFAFIEDNHTTQSDWRVRLNSGQLEVRDNVGVSGINTVLTIEPGGPLDCWTFRDTGDIRIDKDGAGLELGEGQDATINYDGTNLVLDPRAVGSGDLEVANGNVLITGPAYVEFAEMAAPGTATSATARVFLDSSTGEVSAMKDDGSTVSLESGGGGTVTGSTGTTYTGSWDCDLPLLSPATEDDEFEDSSLAGKWTETDTSANMVVTERAWGLELDPSGGADANLAYLHQAKPTSSTTYTVMAKVSILDHQITTGTDYLEIGVGIFEDVATNPTTDGVGFISARFDRNATPDTLYILGQQWVDYNSFGAILGTTINTTAGSGGDPNTYTTLYLRIRKSGTTYGMDYSHDGLHWFLHYEGTMTEVGSNDERVGLVLRQNGAPDARALVHWFRVVDGTADFFQQPPGRRFVFFGP